MAAENKYIKQYKQGKNERRVKKRSEKRNMGGEEVIFIFEKIMAGWKTIRIFNTLKQENPGCPLLKKNVEGVATGNCKVFETELPPNRYAHYLQLREQVYAIHKLNPTENIANVNIPIQAAAAAPYSNN